MDKFRINLKKKMDKYIKLNGISYEYFNKVNGVKNLDGIRRNGGTTFKTLFQASRILDIDIRNFLMFDDYTYIFENSFDTFEEFFVFLSNKVKQLRLSKKFSVKDIIDNFKTEINITTIHKFESCKQCISLDKFYKYLDVLEIDVDTFFLHDEKYKITGNQIKNEISIEEFNNRIYELENITSNLADVSVNISPNVFPTLHGFLKICKSLKVSPRDFFDFEKKQIYNYTELNIIDYIEWIKINLKGKNMDVGRYIRLDAVFYFCNENNLDIKDFFDNTQFSGNLNQISTKML